MSGGTFLGLYGPAGRLVKVFPLAPRAKDVHVATIARGLAHENRWSGATRVAWSVASHAVECSLLPLSDGRAAPPLVQFKRLNHDDSEGLGLRDMPAPLKHSDEVDMGWYRDLEHAMMGAFAERLRLSPMFWEEPEVKWADLVMRQAEARDFRQPNDWDPYCGDTGNIVVCRLTPVGPFAAERRWLRRFEELAEQLGLMDLADDARVAMLRAEQDHALLIEAMVSRSECLVCGDEAWSGATVGKVVLHLCGRCQSDAERLGS